MSRFGAWTSRDGMPAFAYMADQDVTPEAEWDPIQAPPTRRHWVMLGNRGHQMQVANDATAALFDERHVARWLTAPDPAGTGVSLITYEDQQWGTSWDTRPAGTAPTRTFGPTWFEIEAGDGAISLERLLVCTEGSAPWVLIRARLTNTSERRIEVRHVERWVVRPRFLNVGGTGDSRRADAERLVRFTVERADNKLRAVEHRADSDDATNGSTPFPQVSGPTIDFVLESLGASATVCSDDGAQHPTLDLTTDVTLSPGETVELWSRAGADEGSEVSDPATLLAESTAALVRRLPGAAAEAAPQAEREIPWHAALLTGGLSTDELIGGSTLDQSSAYLFTVGFNGAARDPLQHALPLVYCEPDAALDVLRNTSAWARPDGGLPYALDGAKRPASFGFEPSDQNLWSLALASEYAAATGDLGAFGDPLGYHPAHNADPAPLGEHLRRQFRFFVDEVGLGEHGHVRILNADWNDMAVVLSGVDRKEMTDKGESVLNSAMAAWALARYAGLCDRLDDSATASEARALSDQLRDAVSGEWNGRWFNRAYAPGKGPLGETDCWLEVQPWAILCGAAGAERSGELLATIDQHLRADSPLGARVSWPVPQQGDALSGRGEGTSGGIWFSINMTLIWAARDIDADLAWDEWRRMTLANHAETYPDLWIGTLSGPDAYNGVESTRPGQSWGTPALAMQSNPLNNLHSHSQPLLSYLRLLGTEPLPDGALRVRGGASWSSPMLRIDADGHGSLQALGPVVVDTPFGRVEGGPGEITW